LYFVSIRRIIGLSPSGATELVIIKAAPVASVGRIAGRTPGSKKKNSSANTANTFLPVPLRDYRLALRGLFLKVCVFGRGRKTYLWKNIPF